MGSWAGAIFWHIKLLAGEIVWSKARGQRVGLVGGSTGTVIGFGCSYMGSFGLDY